MHTAMARGNGHKLLRENFVLIKEINLLQAQLNVGIGFCWIMDSSLENFWLTPNGKYPRSVLMGLSIT